MKTATTKPGYLPTLDGWRAVAIFGVLVDHSTSQFVRSHAQYSFLHTGPNGVSVFFAISGFLICTRLLEEESAFGKISLRGFYVRRALRILPPAFAYLAVSGILALLGVVIVTRIEWISCLLFFRNYLSPNWILQGWGGCTVHFWSLAVEEHFYLLWPATLAFFGRARAKYISLFGAIAVAIWRFWNLHQPEADRLFPSLLFGTRTDIRLDGLLLGCLAAILIAEPSLRHWLIRVFSPPVWWLCFAAYVSLQLRLRSHTYTIWESALLASLVAGTVLHPATWVGRWLESAPMRWVGRLSYGLYLWQQLFLIPGAKAPLAWLQQPAINLCCLFAVSALSYKYLEKPMIRLGHKLAPPTTPGRTDLTP